MHAAGIGKHELKGMRSRRSTLEAKAWPLLSKIIRLEAADHNGFCECYTCKSLNHWKLTHAGHWKTRGRKPTKLDRKNIRCQCAQCNCFGSSKRWLSGVKGEPAAFEARLKEEGVDTEELDRRSLNGTVATLDELEDFVVQLRDELITVVVAALRRGVMDADSAL